MDFFKVKKFRKAHKPVPEKDLEDKPVTESEEPKNDNAGDDLNKSANADPVAEANSVQSLRAMSILLRVFQPWRPK